MNETGCEKGNAGPMMPRSANNRIAKTKKGIAYQRDLH